MNKFLIFLIHAYQHTLSPDHGLLRAHYPYGFCRSYPSCSEYAVRSLQEQPLVKALWLIFKKLISCNPLSPITYE